MKFASWVNNAFFPGEIHYFGCYYYCWEIIPLFHAYDMEVWFAEANSCVLELKNDTEFKVLSSPLAFNHTFPRRITKRVIDALLWPLIELAETLGSVNL